MEANVNQGATVWAAVGIEVDGWAAVIRCHPRFPEND
jgi:hypothetical protein